MIETSTVFVALIVIATQMCVIGFASLRTVFLVQGRGKLAAGIGFVESIIAITTLSIVVSRCSSEPILVISYALGFAAGTYVGVAVENAIAAGNQVVRIFSRKGSEIARKLREDGLIVTVFHGEGIQGPLDMILIEVKRKRAKAVVDISVRLDPLAYAIFDDIRGASSSASRIAPTYSWFNQKG